MHKANSREMGRRAAINRGIEGDPETLEITAKVFKRENPGPAVPLQRKNASKDFAPRYYSYSSPFSSLQSPYIKMELPKSDKCGNLTASRF